MHAPRLVGPLLVEVRRPTGRNLMNRFIVSVPAKSVSQVGRTATTAATTEIMEHSLCPYLGGIVETA